MCGVVGMASSQPPAKPELLLAMRDEMRHRGPDDAGAWWSADGCVGLAQRRLAIIDLSPGGHQPMLDAAGEVCITFNGEIYNFRDLRQELETHGCVFRTASDTEVVLAAYRVWGVECLSHFNGMFAFGLYDLRRRQLFLARDRAGEKPLFYWRTPNRLVFASELKALMANPALPRRLDLGALAGYFAYGYVTGEQCLLQGVQKLLPAQAALYEVDTGGWRTWRYWQLPSPGEASGVSAADLEAEFEHLLEDAVRRQLVADVPVGVLLSGGIDSSLVTALATRVSAKPVKTFTIAFPGHGTYDESAYARLVAESFGTEHTELVAEPATVDLLPQLARQYDEPLADSSIVPTYLVSRLIRQHATVALGGDGGDELFGGYLHYSGIPRQEHYRRWVPGALRRPLGAAAAHYLPVGLRGRNYLIGLTADLQDSIANAGVFFDSTARAQLLRPVAVSGRAPEARRKALCDPRYSPLQQATRADFGSTMVDAYLVKVDRASMLNSLEVRAPFLDYRLIEFAFGRVPDAWKATAAVRKRLPRRLAARLLPASLDLTRKQGFSIPLQTWFKGAWGSYIEDVLRDAPAAVFDRAAVDALIVHQRQGYANAARLFALTMFELWRREYRVELPAA